MNLFPTLYLIERVVSQVKLRYYASPSKVTTRRLVKSRWCFLLYAQLEGQPHEK